MPQEHLIDLINLLIRKTISDSEFAELSAELESSRSSRLVFIEHMNLHAELTRNYQQPECGNPTEMAAISRQLDDLINLRSSGGAGSNESGLSLFPGIGGPNQDFSKPVFMDSSSSVSSLSTWLPSIFTLMLLIVSLVMVAKFDWQPTVETALVQDPVEINSDANDALDSAKKAVAVLTQHVNAVWNRHGEQIELGQSIAPGMIELTSGLVQIDFMCGATMILEGPAQLEIQDASSGFVHNGKLRVYVPERAKGFTLHSKQCEVIDLGTEFAMDVGENADAEIHVLEGEVRVKDSSLVGSDDDGALLTTGNAIRYVGEAPAESIETEKERFVGPAELNRLSKQAQIAGFDRWQAKSIELQEDDSLLAMYTFQESSDWDRKLFNSSPHTEGLGNGAIVGCKWTEGRWESKRALQFGDPNHRVRVDIPGIHDAITLSSWVKVNNWDKDMALSHPDSAQDNFLHWTLDVSDVFYGATLHLAVTDTQNGVPIREHFGTGINCLSQKDVNQWFHAAVTYDPETRLVTHFLNGTAIGSKQIPRIQKVAIGVANLGNWPYKKWAEGTQYEVRNLDGKMDEFMAFSRALDAQEIYEIYQSGRPNIK